MVDIVEEGIDVAIRVGELADSRLISRRLATHRVGAFASPDYLARRGTPRHPDELVDHECVNFRYQSSGQALRWPFRVGGRTIELTPETGIVADLSDAVAAILEAGGGIGISPTYVAATYVKRGTLVPVLPEFSGRAFRNYCALAREPSWQPKRTCIPDAARRDLPIAAPLRQLRCRIFRRLRQPE